MRFKHKWRGNEYKIKRVVEWAIYNERATRNYKNLNVGDNFDRIESESWGIHIKKGKK